MNGLDNFFKTLPCLKHFSELTKEEHFYAVPKEWYVVVTDIKGSTKAIEEGKYKEVNMLGALGIVSLLNAADTIEIPFIFGGDGASMLIPPSLKEKAHISLQESQKIAQEAYGLHLRVGMLEVCKIYEQGYSLSLAKFYVSKGYFQAISKGGGLSFAEEFIKKQDSILEPLSSDYKANFTGLECRWENLPSPKEETLSLLIKALDKNKEAFLYQEVLERIETLLGNETERSPIKASKMQLSFKPKVLKKEVSLYTTNPIKSLFYYAKLLLENSLGLCFMAFSMGQWGEYKKHVENSVDVQKFDDMLRMVVSTTKEQRLALEAYLQEAYKKQKLAFGLHVSDKALMTCLIFERHGKHIHFVDAADGGYAMAARELKKQLQAN